MDAPGLLLAGVGFFLGCMVLAAVGRWIVGLREALRMDPGAEGRAFAILAAALFSSAPWLVAIIALVGYFVWKEAWAHWIMGGALLGSAFLLLLALGVRKRAAPREPLSSADPTVAQRQIPREGTYRRRMAIISVFIAVVAAIFGFFILGDLPLVVRLIGALAYFAMSALMSFFFWKVLHPKPWVERRKLPE